MALKLYPRALSPHTEHFLAAFGSSVDPETSPFGSMSFALKKFRSQKVQKIFIFEIFVRLKLIDLIEFLKKIGEIKKDKKLVLSSFTYFLSHLYYLDLPELDISVTVANEMRLTTWSATFESWRWHEMSHGSALGPNCRYR